MEDGCSLRRMVQYVRRSRLGECRLFTVPTELSQRPVTTDAMSFVATLLAFVPLLFLALSVGAQRPLNVVNTATGLVFEDYNPLSLEFGNPIVGGLNDPSKPLNQLWSVLFGPEGSRVIASGRHLETRNISVGVDGPVGPGVPLTAQQSGSAFFLQLPFGTKNGIYSIVLAFGPELAITAPTVANETLTLQPYNPADMYQHWIFRARTVDDSSSGSESLGVRMVARPVVDTEGQPATP